MNRFSKLCVVCTGILAGTLTSTEALADTRTAPTLPESVFTAFEDDKDYYLYNVEKDAFMSSYESDASYLGCTTSPLKVHITLQSEGCYSIQLVDGGMYLHHSGGSLNLSSSYSAPYDSWNIVPTDNTLEYNIQISKGKKNYNADQFAGYSTAATSTQLYYNQASDQAVTWKLVSGDAGADAELYASKKRLYTALEATSTWGEYVSQYDAIYNSATSTAEEIWNAAFALENGSAISNEYVYADWNEYPILFGCPNGKWSGASKSYSYLYKSVDPESIVSLSATVVVDDNVTLSYIPNSINGSSNYTNFDIEILLDGNKYNNIGRYETENGARFFIELEAGLHTITWKFTNATSSSKTAYIRSIGVEKTPTISVNLGEPGSLGTEILYYVDRLQDVRKLKIKGTMNDDDWEKIDMIKAHLYSLDLSEAIISEISDSRFRSLSFLHKVVLPEGVVRIGNRAFENSYLEEINFPESLTTLGYYAFANTSIREAIIGEKCTTWNTYNSYNQADQFSGCLSLRTVKLPDGLNIIPPSAFEDCRYIHFNFPASLNTIDNYAFRGCYNLGWENETLVIPSTVTSIGSGAFDNTNFKKAVLPVGVISPGSSCLPNSVKTIRLESPTLVAQNSIVDNSYRSGITLEVPKYLVSAYKLDKYWYNYGSIVGFETDEIKDWKLRADLVLSAHDRLNGTPNIKLYSGGGLKINGTDGMPINDLHINVNPDSKMWGRIFSNADDVKVNGNLDISYYTNTKNRWYYISLPYNVRVGDIKCDAQRAIRYYDGANRAANGTGSNWKNYSNDDIIPAGTGFIFNVSETGICEIPSLDDDSKQYMTSANMFVKALAENPSEVTSNRGWNLVGNPYQAWYNIHKMNFTAPITVRNNNYNGYAAYSIIDDDFALAPNQAFFVQCPTGTSEISFPLDGRQLTSEIESQNGVRPRMAKAAERRLVDVTLSAGNDASDRTRVVLNNQASLAYEVECDASKFMGEADVPQLFTLDAEGTIYAINERPVEEGTVPMGVSIPASGTYTLALTRNSVGTVMVVDHLTGETIDITNGEYSFYAEAGNFAERFSLKFDTETGIATAEPATVGTSGIYTIAGAYVGRSINSLPAGTYIIRNGIKVNKVVVK